MKPKMNKNFVKREITQKGLLDMLKTAVMDGVLHCPYCGYGDIEPDYDECYECHRKNPLKERGLI